MTKAFVLIFMMLCFFVSAATQQPTEEADPLSAGITLYEQGDFEGAIKALRVASKKTKKDPKPWHYLGLSLLRQGNRKAAYEAFDQSIGMRERLISIELDREDREWRDDQLRTFKELLQVQVEDQSKLMEILTDLKARELGKLVLTRSKALAECVDANSRMVDGKEQLRRTDLKLEKARVLVNPTPRYPESARQDKLNGTVVLKAIFVADGSVQYIEAVRSPDSRLTAEAIRAARLIKFTPNTICRNPVSYPIQLEYSFNSLQ